MVVGAQVLFIQQSILEKGSGQMPFSGKMINLVPSNQESFRSFVCFKIQYL